MALANKLANRDRNIKGLLIALDAKKAFDSVRHKYIEENLKKIGLASFIPTFRLLYKENQVDIMINGQLCKGYSILNGVKQGDALSCTLFILAMEPLIRNIEANLEIGSLRSVKYDVTIPKCIGYADDINILTTDSIRCVRACIREYEKFSKVSGLQLNADKTEIFKLTSNYVEQAYQFQYRGEQTLVRNLNKIKVNGLELSTNDQESHRLNFEAVKKKMDNQFAGWANRGLSLLGKILIYKTFGLSQLIYIARVIDFTKQEHNEIRNLIYKFLWNRNYQAAKAPDRIKRVNLNASLRQGGFGMIDHELVVKAMNAKQVIVNLGSTHPMKDILCKLIVNQKSHFNASTRLDIDGPTNNYVEALNLINKKVLVKDHLLLQQDRLAQHMLLEEKVKNVTRPDRQNSLELVMIRNRGLTTVRQLLGDPNLANHFRMRLLHYSYATLMDACLAVPNQNPVNDRYVPLGHKYKLIEKVTSKELRIELTPKEDIHFKIQVSRENIANYLPKISKLKCTRAKNLALRLLHGDIYTGTRMLKFGMRENDECCRCKQSETLEHLLQACWYPKQIWTKVLKLYRKTDRRKLNYNNNLDFVIGTKLSSPKIKLHLEIIRRLLAIERPSILPRTLISQALDHLIICDTQHRTFYKKLRNAHGTDT